MTTLFIVDDHAVVIEGIYSLLRNEQDLKLLGHASTGNGCLEYLSTHQPDIILLDISLPDTSGIDLCKAIKRLYPGIYVLALTTFNQGTYVRKMMESGASGYLLKNAGKKEIIEAIRMVMKGKIYLSFEAGHALKSTQPEDGSIPPLTKREKEVLIQIADGLTNNQIAEKLFISIDTVDSHRRNLHTKLNVRNTAMLIRRAIECNLLS